MKSMHWTWEHLPAHLRAYSRPICELAREYERTLPQSAELNAGLRKLMEAKDCFVRAAIETHGTRSSDRMHPEVCPRCGKVHGNQHRCGPTDPVSNQPLPADSPYSMAHVPVTEQRPFITTGKFVDSSMLDPRSAPSVHRESCDVVVNPSPVTQCNCDRGFPS